MPFKVQVGPPQIAIHQGQTVLITEEDGQIGSASDKGLYYRDTRLISAWSVYANGDPWTLLNGGAIAYYASRMFLTNPDMLTQDGKVAEAHLVARRQPGDRRRHTRGFRCHEFWDCEGAVLSRDLRALRFRRCVRGEVARDRPARADQHDVGPEDPEPVEQLSEWGFRGAR